MESTVFIPNSFRIQKGKDNCYVVWTQDGSTKAVKLPKAVYLDVLAVTEVN